MYTYSGVMNIAPEKRKKSTNINYNQDEINTVNMKKVINKPLFFFFQKSKNKK